MKRYTLTSFILIPFTLAIMLVGCSQFGANPPAPTKFEEGLFNVQTNFVPQVVYQTNVVDKTNIVVTMVTNQVPAFTMTPGAGAQTVAQTAGSIGNAVLPGIGDAVSMGVLALVGLWGHLRSYKGGKTLATQQATSAALVQEVQTIRNFIKTIPSGAKYDTAITAWLQKHQVETGSATQVLQLIRDDVSDPHAQIAANEILSAVKAATTP